MKPWDDSNSGFVKEDCSDGQLVWSIYSSSGEKIAETTTKEFAFWIAKQNDLMLHTVN